MTDENLLRPLSIGPKTMYAQLKPHIPTLTEHFIFPLVCLSEDEIEMFNEDPAEYARQFFGGASPFDLWFRLRGVRLTTGRGLCADGRFRQTTHRLHCRLVRFADCDRPGVLVDSGRDSRQDKPVAPPPIHSIGR